MMIVRLLLVAAAFAVSLLAAPTPSECVYCPSYRCYGPCGGDCVCVSPPGGGGGSCYGVERVPSLLARGYAVVQ